MTRTEHRIERDRALRREGFAAVGTAGRLLHPECRTEEESKYTSTFYRDTDAEALQGQRCSACNGSIAPWL